MSKFGHTPRGASQHSFARVPQIEIQRSTFKRNRNYKTTFNAGWLIPFFLDEVLPGDTFKTNVTMLVRLATPLKPFMDNLYVDTHFFFVPNRLVWNNWERFQGAQDDPDDSTDFVVPKVVSTSGTGWLYGSLADYFGIPTGIQTLDANALPFRGYNLIWNEWFRDQNIQDSLQVPKGDGTDLSTIYEIRRRGKRHDYFTSCLPWPQKGPAATIPFVGSTAPVKGNGLTLGLYDGSANYGLGYNTLGYMNMQTGSYNQAAGSTPSGSGSTGPISIGVTSDGTKSGLIADLSTGFSTITINQLRESVQLQRYLERAARGGTRYVEILKSFWGVTSPDFRLQRPEYLGGSSRPFSISAIPQTSASTGSDNLGDLAAFGVDQGRSGFTKSFVEHGFVFGFVSVRADLTYQQGLHRMWSRRTRYDYATPVLAHLGEQAVLRKEIYAQGNAYDNVVFGYQERFGEYRFGYSMITGKLRSTDPQTLDYWHLAQKFASAPTLSPTFIQENPPVERVVAVTSEPQFILDSFIECDTTRALPMYGVPGLMDHF